MTDAPYVDGVGAEGVEFALDTNVPGCVQFGAYASTSKVLGGYTKGKFCVCGNEEIEVAEPTEFFIELNETKEGYAPRNKQVDSNGIYTVFAKDHEGWYNLKTDESLNTSALCGIGSGGLFEDTNGTPLVSNDIYLDTEGNGKINTRRSFEKTFF